MVEHPPLFDRYFGRVTAISAMYASFMRPPPRFQLRLPNWDIMDEYGVKCAYEVKCAFRR